MSHLLLAIVLATAPSLCLIVGFTWREMQLQRMCRGRMVITYGITGRQRDLAIQIADLTRKHEQARRVGQRTIPDVIPMRRVVDFPTGGDAA